MSSTQELKNKPQNSLINPDVIVIGAGIAGSMITKHLRSKGKQVLLIDSKKSHSGSKCSSGMWRDGWVNDKIREKYIAGLEVLHEHAGIEIIECENLDALPQSSKKAEPAKRIDELMYVNWKSICDIEAADFEVINVCKNVVTCVSNTNGQFNEQRKTQFIASDKVFICAGAYTDEILSRSGYSTIGLDRYFGTAIETKDIKNPMSKIKTWAPYKQFLAARVSKTILKFSDGSMVKNPPIDKGDERCDRVHDRLKEHIHEVMGKSFKFDDQYTRELFGMRPYLPAKSNLDFVNKHDTDLYSFTGTAKNTTILCGYLALRAWEILSGEDWQYQG